MSVYTKYIYCENHVYSHILLICYIDFHLKLPAEMSLAEAHRLGDEVEASIMQRFPRADVLIHLDPDDLPDEDV